MSKNSWKQRQREAASQPPLSKVAKLPYKDMLKDAFQIFAQKYLFLLVPFILFAAVVAFIKVLVLPDINWNFSNINDFLLHINYKQILDPTYEMSAQEYQTWILANQYYWFSEILLGCLDAIPQYFGILTTVVIVEHTYSRIGLSTKKSRGGSLLRESFTQPFRMGKAGSAILIPLIISIIVPLGLILLYIPGFIALAYLMFSLQTIALEKQSPKNFLRVGVDHARNQFWKIIGTILIGFLCTLAWDSLRRYGLNAIWPSPGAEFYNPQTRNFGLLFLYFFGLNLWMALIYPLISSLYTMLYLQIKTEKVEGSHSPQHPVELEEKSDVRISRGTQQMRRCPHCARSIPVNLTICSHCKQPVPRG